MARTAKAPQPVDTDEEDDALTFTADDKIIEEAKTRFRRCEEWEGVARKNFVQDIKFANADAYNMWQWPDDARNVRQLDRKPCFTINKTRQHCLQVMNDARQNKSSIAVRPVGDGATYEAAQVFQGISRHIEYISNANSAYQTATHFQVQGGIGYWRVVTGYVSDDSFDQEIFIRRVRDPLSVYVDPDIDEADGSDAMFAFVFEDEPRDEWDKAHPSLKGEVGRSVLGVEENLAEDHIRVAEYYRVVETKDRLIALPEGDTVRASKMPPELAKQAMNLQGARVRWITDRKVEWYKIAGDKIIERTVWVGTTIPIVRVVGEETVIDGKLDRKGHVRALIDPQKNLNYWTSEAASQVALQTKMPWLAAVAAVESYEDYWANANIENYAYLPFNHVDDKGAPIPPPTRNNPPVMAQAYVEGIRLAQDELQLVSGQYQAQMGAPSNEQSGVAIQQRQRQGDNATYHYIDHLAAGIRRTGKILVEIIPKVYDTARVVKIMAEDGTESEITIDPMAKQAFLQHEKDEADNIKAIFNPQVGRYEVEADVGPAFATRRQEAFNAFTQIATQSPEMMSIMGDLMFKAADFPMADEIAERLRRMVPPQATGDGPPPAQQQLQQQVQQLTSMLTAAGEALKAEKQRATNHDEKLIIDAYRAETDRIDALKAEMAKDPQFVISALQQLMTQMSATDPTQDFGDAAAPAMADPTQPGPMPPAGAAAPIPQEQAA